MNTPKTRNYRSTVRLKPDLKITIEAGDKRFTIGVCRMLDGTYLVKRGRHKSEKMPYATLTEIFTVARKFAVRNATK